ncbi:DNA-directed RNA polymerase subunit beta [Paenibacillus rigui]|uniref:DNA-directed RNA polymerase subunit beta n=1 Tax=Paenibacillus rigui TaxID=554312 RepID=A0A229USK9_9BACL|nr:DNA-directed RNA polymerase subunit beta [Paenibacillus rigui]OXM86384.1 hypothetical protein CF651_10660 [Paenibacillus rigui]
MTENEEITKKQKKKVSSPKWKRRLFLTWKWLGIPFLCVIGLGAGMVIGYVYLGKRPMEEVYEFDTWRHIYDLVFSET